MKKLSKDTVNTIIGAVALLAIAAALIAPGLIYGLVAKYKALEKDYKALQTENVELVLDTFVLDTWNEIILEDYEKLQEDYRRLQGNYEELLKEADYDAKQIISDYDDVIDYLYNYQSYSERNPDVTFEQFIKMKNPELWERLMEYATY